MGQGEGQTPIPGTLTPLAGAALPHAVARRLLACHADRLPDLSGIVVIVPNHRAAQDFARALARAAGCAALIPPTLMPLRAWAESLAGGRAEAPALRLARLHGVLRRSNGLGAADTWTLAGELLGLADELTATRFGEAPGARLRALHGEALARETALVETVWATLGVDHDAPEARYARALDALLETLRTAPRPVHAYALGPLTGVERHFLDRCATCVPFEHHTFDTSTGACHVLQQAWQHTDPPLAARAAALAARFPSSPLGGRITLAPAAHLEAEAQAVAAWVAGQLKAGHRDIALIALDRATARRVRALLERLDVLVADETGWALSTTAAAAVVDRWLECVAADFPHAELLDLLKSPFVLGAPGARQDEVLRFELALRRHGVAQGLADMQRLAHAEFGTLPAWLATLADARQGFGERRAPLAVWLARLADSLACLGAIAPLTADTAGAVLLDTLDTLRRELATDTEPYGFAEWRHWLDRALEAASFVDAAVSSPVVLTSVPAARGRLFDAVAVLGADARHLPPRPAPGLFSQATRTELGLSGIREATELVVDDLMQLLVQGPALLSWQAWRDDEPNPASPLVLRLQALHQMAWGASLPLQAPGRPPAQPGEPPAAACVTPAPTVPAVHLPRRYSPTVYQILLDCPYRFFVRSVLGIRELDAADEALDKSDYGSALHRILKVFHDGAPPTERDAALAQLQSCAAAGFEALPAYTAAAWNSRWNPVQAAYVDAWLDWVAQGWHYASGETEFTVPRNVDGLGEVILHGRVDRVDVRDDVRTVIDYKTASRHQLKKKLDTPDEAVQLPFYAWLADAAAAFLPIDETPVIPLTLEGDTDIGAIAERLPALLAAIAAGAPLRAQGVDATCAHCEARGLCRKGMWHA